MKIAIIGTGISGNVVAYHLNKQHDISVFEASDYVGGHTHTHDVKIGNEQHNIDTGFIVFNQNTYPNFIKLLSELNVDYQLSNMSFSVQCEKTNLEYNGSSLNQLFSQRRNIFRPSFYKMIMDILRFNKESLELLSDTENNYSLGDYLSKNNYSQYFIHHYIIPMGAAIWSTDHNSMLDFPARFFVQFFHNHGMLSINQRPDWFVIKGGSSQYITPLIKQHKDKIRLSAKVQNIRRTPNKVFIKAKGAEEESFDYVFIASHSDQALSMLQNPSDMELKTLSAIPYTDNEAILHYDDSVMPKRKRAWAAWNYHLTNNEQKHVTISYNMNILQSLKSQYTFCVTLNPSQPIDESKIIKKIQYTHPFFTLDGVKAQRNHSAINGTSRTYYCGAYWHNGFHEDGVVSALQALKDFNQEIGNEQQNILWPRSA
ncbi:NAD(P)/FAD-dependent oxidoreductase [Aliikangiella sp. IMCC44359]|uniref:NAD(P)/FAD-dependent oxidoreductase n=1 Tax=Aliikangiella sp. IMCC44359 TaxID=3459125 RepID=UPI00403A942B